MSVLRGCVGVLVFLGLAVLLSRDRRAIDWTLVAAGIGLQVVFALLALLNALLGWAGRPVVGGSAIYDLNGRIAEVSGGRSSSARTPSAASPTSPRSRCRSEGSAASRPPGGALASWTTASIAGALLG